MIVDTPALTGLIAPLELFIVATPVVPLLHVPPASPSDVKETEPLEHIPCVPLKVPAFGCATTLTFLLSLFHKPFVPPYTVHAPIVYLYAK